jgi:hypothetical protein
VNLYYESSRTFGILNLKIASNPTVLLQETATISG